MELLKEGIVHFMFMENIRYQMATFLQENQEGLSQTEVPVKLLSMEGMLISNNF